MMVLRELLYSKEATRSVEAASTGQVSSQAKCIHGQGEPRIRYVRKPGVLRETVRTAEAPFRYQMLSKSRFVPQCTFLI